MKKPAIAVAPSAKASTIPSFALYGEAAEGAQEVLHIEEIRARSSLYQWEISPHTHKGLYQLLWVQSGALAVQLDAAAKVSAAQAAVAAASTADQQATHDANLALARIEADLEALKAPERV